MAYMSQEKKKGLAPGINAVLKKYGVKATIAVRHHSTLVVNIKSGPIDFVNSVNAKTDQSGRENEFHYQVNPYWISDHWTGEAAEFLAELKAAMSVGNHDRSDPYTDYHDVGWYYDINIGKWDKPYEYVAAAVAA